MNVKRIAILVGLALLAWPWSSAQAWWRVGIGIGIPVYRPYYPVYVAPPPVVYVQPAPVYYAQPAPVYAQPAPAPQPVYQAPAREQVPAPAPVSPDLPAQPVPIR